MQTIFILFMSALAAWTNHGKTTHLQDDMHLSGPWIRISPAGPVSLTFTGDGTVEGDLGNDMTIDIVSEFSIEGNEILFNDRQGVACPEPGRYRIYSNEYYLSFDLISDNCAGRVRSTMGFWVRPDFNDRLAEISNMIDKTSKPEDYLNRARMHMATGSNDQARQDLDVYLKHQPSDARALVNRAGTRMVNDLKGAVDDCNLALRLDPENKNAYFLRGLASYGLGNKEEACRDFYRAIELGFEILKEAEYDKCADIWKSIQ